MEKLPRIKAAGTTVAVAALIFVAFIPTGIGWKLALAIPFCLFFGWLFASD